jgi:hypothetical protein
VQVRSREGLASRLEAKCCDAEHEAYTAVAWGVRLSHKRLDIAGAESFYSLEGNMCGAGDARCCRPAGVEGHITCKGTFAEILPIVRTNGGAEAAFWPRRIPEVSLDFPLPDDFTALLWQ